MGQSLSYKVCHHVQVAMHYIAVLHKLLSICLGFKRK